MPRPVCGSISSISDPDCDCAIPGYCGMLRYIHEYSTHVIFTKAVHYVRQLELLKCHRQDVEHLVHLPHLWLR